MKKFIVSKNNNGMLSVEEVDSRQAESLVREYNALYGNRTHIVATESELKDIRGGRKAGPIPISASKVSNSKPLNFKETSKTKSRWDD